MEGEGYDHGMNREASSFGGVTESGDDESDSSGEGVEMVTSEADDTEVENTSLVPGRAVSATSRAGSNVHSGVDFDPKGRGPFSEGFADAPATFESVSYGPDQQFAALRAGEAKISAEHIPGPLRATIFKGCTRAEKRRSKPTAQIVLVSVEDKLDIALHVEEENTLEQALELDTEASVEMTTGKMQDLPPPPTTQEEVPRSPFCTAFEHFDKEMYMRFPPVAASSKLPVISQLYGSTSSLYSIQSARKAARYNEVKLRLTFFYGLPRPLFTDGVASVVCKRIL